MTRPNGSQGFSTHLQTWRWRPRAPALKPDHPEGGGHKVTLICDGPKI